MNRSTRIFNIIARDLPGLVRCKDMLVVVPTERIVRGFLLEATTERDRVYLWRVVAPLYRPMSYVFLTYSDRIPESGEDVYIDRANSVKSASTIRAIIGDGHVEYLRSIRTPEEFLRHTDWIQGNSPILQRIDRALTLYLTGQTDQAIEALRRLDTEIDLLDKSRQEYISPIVKNALHEIDVDRMGLQRLLDEWVDRNIITLGLQASRSSQDGSDHRRSATTQPKG